MTPHDKILPATEPTLTGAHGMAWLIDLEAIAAKHPGSAPAEAQACGWLVYAPYAHQLWHSYAISCINLRDIPGIPPAKLNLPGATHELMVFALDPERPMRVDDRPAYLAPANFVAQFIEPTDEAAAARIRQAVQDVCDAKLNPDTDYMRHWIHRFGASNVIGAPKRAGETRIVVQAPGEAAVELVIPPHPGPQDLH